MSDDIWQPIETAPRDGSWVLVWERYINDKYHPAEVARFTRSRDGWINSGRTNVPNPSHWMPLPEPPSEG